MKCFSTVDRVDFHERERFTNVNGSSYAQGGSEKQSYHRRLDSRYMYTIDIGVIIPWKVRLNRLPFNG